MNSTNRVVNRLFLVVVGAALIAAGVAAVGVAVLPQRAGILRSLASTIRELVAQGWTTGVPFGGVPHVPWMLLLVPIVALIAIVLLLTLIFAQGRGATSRVVESLTLPAEAPGRLTVSTSVAGEVIRRSLADERDVAAVRLSTYRVKGAAAVKLTITPRRGAAPMRVLARTERAIADWDSLLGLRVPVLIHLNGGVRAAWSKPVHAI